LFDEPHSLCLHVTRRGVGQNVVGRAPWWSDTSRVNNNQAIGDIAAEYMSRPDSDSSENDRTANNFSACLTKCKPPPPLRLDAWARGELCQSTTKPDVPFDETYGNFGVIYSVRKVITL